MIKQRKDAGICRDKNEKVTQGKITIQLEKKKTPEITVERRKIKKISVTQCVAIRFRLCWRHSDDLFVCFGAKPKYTRPEVEEGMKIPEKTERAVDRAGQKRTVGLS